MQKSWLLWTHELHNATQKHTQTHKLPSAATNNLAVPVEAEECCSREKANWKQNYGMCVCPRAGVCVSEM